MAKKRGNSLILQLRKQIIKDYGKKCRTFEIGCVACQAHLSLGILESLYDIFIKSKAVQKTSGK